MDNVLKALNLVIADDDTDDQYLMQKAIWEVNPKHKITSVYNGMQLLDYLQRTGTYKNCTEPIPDCVLLDLQMPLLNGTEALRKMKSAVELKTIPVYVFSGMQSGNNQPELITLGASAVFEKSPKDYELKKIMSDILAQVSVQKFNNEKRMRGTA